MPPSDMVYVAPSTYHWVQALGTCVNLSWNIGPPTGTQYVQACLAEERNLRRVRLSSTTRSLRSLEF